MICMENENKTTNPTSAEQTSKEAAPFAKGRKFATIIIVALFAIGIVQALTGSRGFVTTEINDQYLGVCGTYGDPMFLELSTITDVQLVDSFEFGTCLEGEETKNTVSGVYSCAQFEEYTAHAYLDEACIIVHSPSGVLVFNCGSDSHTEDLFEELCEATDINS